MGGCTAEIPVDKLSNKDECCPLKTVIYSPVRQWNIEGQCLAGLVHSSASEFAVQPLLQTCAIVKHLTVETACEKYRTKNHPCLNFIIH